MEISLTRLRTSVIKLRLKIKKLTLQLKEKDYHIAELEAKLTDKEAQRKELLSYLYKPNKKDTSDKKPLGKKPGAIGFHRPKPKPEDITERRIYTPLKGTHQPFQGQYWQNIPLLSLLQQPVPCLW